MPSLLVIFETDCPTCQLAIPYLNSLHASGASIRGLSQDSQADTDRFIQAMPVRFPVKLDQNLRESQLWNPASVPAFFLLDDSGELIRATLGYAKADLNGHAEALSVPPVAVEADGNPAWKPGCGSRHLEPPQQAASPAQMQ